MNSHHAAVQAGDLDRLDRVVRLLEAEWFRHGRVELREFWTEQQRVATIGSVDSLGLLAELIKADLRCRFDRGETPAVASYLERFPELRGTDTRVLSLIYEEFCLNEERGHAPDVASFCERYPDWKDSLASQLRYHRLISTAAGSRLSLPPFPNPGDEFEEFHLESLLGTGGTSRVFLARDNSLGGKQVVLKVSSDRGQEPKAQGPLDHPHIVPVNSVTFQTEKRLRGLSMPFRAGLPLDEIIRRVKPAERPRKAIALWQTLVDGVSDHGGSGTIDQRLPKQSVGNRRRGPRGDGWEGFPVRGTYAQGAAWVAMTMARALHYAHGMRTFHRDVKPANVLLTLQYGPQLFDFNLADSPHSAHQAEAALHGGTLPYMAPEQIEAFLDPDLWGKVEAKADIYSLGLVLRELLTGVMPELPPDTLSPPRALRRVLDSRAFLEVSVRRLNPAVPHALDAIVAKCLTFSPDDRYADAQALAQDLDRFLKSQPLVSVSNPSRRERLGNWATRRRRALAASAGLILVMILLYDRLIEFIRPPIQTKAEFQAAVQHCDQGQFDLSLGLLDKLETNYARSTLRRLYLAFALDGKKNHTGAETYFVEALKDRDFENTLVDWARLHPELAEHLQEFASCRFDMNFDEYDKVYEDEESDKASRRPHYKLAREALRLATKIKPESGKAQRLMAKVEDFDGDFESAHARISKAIKAIGPDRRSTTILLFCVSLRSQIATHWADSLRAQGNSDAVLKALRLMKESQKDLEAFHSALFDSDSQGQRVKEAEYLTTKLKAMLTLAEIEIDLHDFAKADRHLDRARSTITELLDHSLRRGLPTPVIATVHRRLNVARERLRSAKSSPSSAMVTDPREPAAVPDQRIASAQGRGNDSGPSSKGAAAPRRD